MAQSLNAPNNKGFSAFVRWGKSKGMNKRFDKMRQIPTNPAT